MPDLVISLASTALSVADDDDPNVVSKPTYLELTPVANHYDNPLSPN